MAHLQTCDEQKDMLVHSWCKRLLSELGTSGQITNEPNFRTFLSQKWHGMYATSVKEAYRTTVDCDSM